jgi:hypothetical protein
MTSHNSYFLLFPFILQRKINWKKFISIFRQKPGRYKWIFWTCNQLCEIDSECFRVFQNKEEILSFFLLKASLPEIKHTWYQILMTLSYRQKLEKDNWKPHKLAHVQKGVRTYSIFLAHRTVTDRSKKWSKINEKRHFKLDFSRFMHLIVRIAYRFR